MKIKLYYSLLLAVFILSGCAADNGFVYRRDKAFSYTNSGHSHFAEGNYEQALADYNKVIELNPKIDNAYWNRGEIYKHQKEYDLALSNFNKAIELNPSPNNYLGRGSVYYMKKQYDSAIKEYIKAIKLDNNFAAAYHYLAWLLATCSDEKYRDGLKAVEIAKKAVELAKKAVDPAPLPIWNSTMLNTLAAAYAEAGDFDMAVKNQEKAIQLLSEKGRSDHLDSFEKRLESYKRDIPWTEK